MRTRLAVAATAAVVALVAAGCSSSSSGGGTGTPTTASSPPSTSPSGTASATQSPTGSAKPTPSFSSTVSASKRCVTKHLRLSLGQGQGVAGATITPIVFTNVGKKPCTLFGYPGVSFVDASGAQVGVDAAHRGGEEATVTLGHNDSANAQLSVPDPGNFAPSDCQQQQATRLRVFPPGSFAALTVDDAMIVCTTATGAANVHPVTPGSG
ncbi:MAG TPA: DUF4232 domain-containing protein [Mycobacteriales bacterium]|nr:DUF4232 domain-containing protein [Mycobacteriales bacterium]